MSEENIVETDEEQNVQESSSAQASLKPNSRASKSEMLSQVMKVFSGMKREDLSKFLNDTLAQVGKEDETVPDYSGKNASSVATSGSSAPAPSSAPAMTMAAMKEDVQDLFSEDETLSEEFKEKAGTLFEAAVNNRVQLETVRLEEEFEQKLEEQVTETVDELHEQVNKYMQYVVEQWMEQNEVAIENNFRVQITENFIEGLKGLFAENYVDVPAEKVDMIGDLESKIAELEESLNTVHVENIELHNLIQEARIEAAFEDVSEDLVDTQIEKLRSLSEGIEYSDVDEYIEKLTIIKNQYFNESKKESNGSTGLIDEEESVGSNDVIDEAVVPEHMKQYFNAISNTIKK